MTFSTCSAKLAQWMERLLDWSKCWLQQVGRSLTGLLTIFAASKSCTPAWECSCYLQL